ncbi:LAME_0H17392g1_1 [Lachancea meyersii CBS 8951]|uniref:LAME_0H17392g1_1 n=1 Tax=Lachancea meyersii CBS 8951 TaxID=1266667 RepID=A0A1G4KIH8_9SACH|nr:LAME_0H17392g1_1 [Lachancea meyersii CBS 8951]
MSEAEVARAIGLLKSQPPAEDIKRCLLLLSEEKSLSLESAAVIVKYVVPIFPSLPRDIQKELIKVFGCHFTLVTHTMNLIDMVQKNPEVSIYKAFLMQALSENSSALSNYLGRSQSPSEIQILKSAFFGSKILSRLGSGVDIVAYVEVLRGQIEYIFEYHHSLNQKMYAEFLVALLSLHEGLCLDLVFRDVALRNADRFQKFLQVLLSASVLCRNRLFRSLLKYLDIVISSESAHSAYNLLRSIGPVDIQYDLLIDLKNPLLSVILVHTMSEKQKLSHYRYLMGFFRRGNSTEDLATCFLLAIIFEHLPSEVRQSISSDNMFLDAVTARLSSQHAVVRERTMFLAKQVTNGGLEYESDFEIVIPDFTAPETDTIAFDLLQKTPDSENDSLEPLEGNANIARVLDLTLSKNQSDEEGFTIVFLKDLVREFEQEEKNKSDRIYLLKATVRLVRQKKDFILEIESYSSQLLTMICVLNNSFEEPQFQEWKINALVSIIVVVPEKITELIQILFGQELSLQQRITILSVMSLAARELRGIDDAFIVKPQTDFPTERLPWDSPNKPISGETPRSIEASNSHTVWRSRKLDKAAKGNTAPVNRFQRVAPKFFYPLAHGWLNGIDMGVYDEMFKKHYLSTMQLILSAAQPHYEFSSMYALMCSVIEDAIKNGLPLDDLDLAKLSELSKGAADH